MPKKQSLADLLRNPRFVAIVGMLGSNGSGEAANAAAMATKMLAEAGATWGELLEANGGRGGGVDRSLLNSLQHQLHTAQSREEAAKNDLRWARENIGKLQTDLAALRETNHKLLEQHAETVHKLRALQTQITALQKTRAEKAEPAGGWRPFHDTPPWDEEDARQPNEAPKQRTWSQRTAEPEFPIPYPKIRTWLDMLQGNFWDDLNDWEQNFFYDFIDRKKAVKTDKQYAIFVRTAEKVGYALDF